MQSISDDDASIDTARISEYLDPKKKKKILTYDVSDDEDDDIGKIFSECTSNIKPPQYVDFMIICK